MTAGLVLEPRLDLVAVRPLVEALAAQQGADLTIDASAVERLGGLALQALLAARQAWDREGHDLIVSPRSAPFDAALETFGLDRAAFSEGAAA